MQFYVDLDDLGEEIYIRDSRRVALGISEEVPLGVRAAQPEQKLLYGDMHARPACDIFSERTSTQ